MRVPWGNATGAERLQIRLYDLLAHGWDVEPPGFPAQGCQTIFAEGPAAGWHPFGPTFHPAAHGRFAEPQAINDTATARESFAAFPGRRSDRNLKVWPSLEERYREENCTKALS